MMHDEEATGTRCPEVWKLNPKNFGPSIKSIKFLGSGVKTRVGRLSGNLTKFLGLTASCKILIICLIAFFAVLISKNVTVILAKYRQKKWRNDCGKYRRKVVWLCSTLQENNLRALVIRCHETSSRWTDVAVVQDWVSQLVGQGY